MGGSQMHPTVRTATEGDADAIGVIHAETWKTTYKGIVHEGFLAKQDPHQRAQEARARIANPSTDFLVVEMNSEIAGFIDAGKSRNPEIADAQIHAIYIAQKYQNRGLGKLLFAAAIERAKERSFRSIFVSVLSKNVQAIAFYRKSGGNLVGHDCVVIEGIRYETDTLLWDVL
jgi:ribosomal protein S18 acetylase RimI-like enzyme